MSAYEDSYKSQLQGVSQQIARDRLDGQVTSQDNMLSDPATNLRRRPGAAYAYDIAMPGATPESVLAWDTDLAGVQCHIVLNTADGVVRVLDSAYAQVATLPASAYLTTANPLDIQVASVGDEFFLANTGVKPTLGASATGMKPKFRAFFYVKAGAFSKTYDVHVKNSMAGVVREKTFSYTTPNGTGTGDAAASTAEAVAKALSDAITANAANTLSPDWLSVHSWYDGPYVYVECDAGEQSYDLGLSVSTSSGNSYMVASGSEYIRQEADLPSRLPAQGDGMVTSTGELRSLRYYRYDHSKMAWLETGEFTSPLTIANVPVSITSNGSAWVLNTSTFEGRLAGDADSNPDPDFVSRGITGMSNFQGRLVLLSGSLVNMSASGKPRRFYRSTVTAIIDSDCISVGAAAASSAAYRHAVPFGRDLLLFSDKYQAVVPGGDAAITPRTATVVVNSTYEADTTCRPVTCGRTLMYAAPRSRDFFGVLEMLPSSTLAGQYTSYDSTVHLPKYMAGRCRFGVSSSVANMVLFAPTTDRYSLIVHEYTWQGDQKVQQAWHKWTFRYKIAAAYFAGQTVHVLFVNNGHLVACTIDPRSGLSNSETERLAKLDISTFVDVTGNVVAYPAWLTAFDPDCLPNVRMAVATGALSGEPVSCVASGTTLTTDLSFPAGRVSLGFPFVSSFSPTPPMRKDSNGVKISSNKMTVLRFMLGTNNTAEFSVAVSDATSPYSEGAIAGPLYYSSRELSPGNARVAGDSVTTIPARTDANTTNLVISSDGVGELNVVSLEFVAKYHAKISRMR